MRVPRSPRQLVFGVIAAAAISLATVALVPSTASAAPLCAFNASAHSLAVASQPGQFVVSMKASTPYLDVSDTHCALLTDVDTVSIDMSASPSFLNFDLSGGPLGPGFTDEGNGSSEIEFQVSGISATATEIRVTGSTGDDGVTLGQSENPFSGTTGQINLDAFADASPDVDVTFGGLPLEESLWGKEGNDLLSAAGTGTFRSGSVSVPVFLQDGTGSDQVTGGIANDRVSASLERTDGPDVYTGGAGIDEFFALCSDLKSPYDYASLTLDDVANDGIGCPFSGCAGDNVRSDFEAVYGCRADDKIVGDADAETLSGGGGTDVLDGAGGDDTLLSSDPGTQTFRGGDGSDTVSFASIDGPVYVRLDAFANDGANGQGSFVEGTVENVVGSPGDDAIIGDGGPNQLAGFGGPDEVRGGGGNDTILPGYGAGTSVGGSGSDTLSYSDLALDRTPLTFDLAAQAVSGSSAFGEPVDQTFSSVESFVGSKWADVFDGAAANDTFRGGLGADDILGRAGDDSLFGQGGNDDFDGGRGTDVCAQGTGTGSLVNCES